MMRIFAYCRALSGSFYSRETYWDVGRNWRGGGFLYLVFLAFMLCALVIGSWWMAVAQVPVNAGYAAESAPEGGLSGLLTQLAAQMPPITITQGKASIKETEPYFIYSPENDKPFAIIDTTGGSSLEKSGAYLLVTKTHLLYRGVGGKVEKLSLSDMARNDTVVTANTIKHWLLWVLPLAMMPVGIVLVFIQLALWALIFGVLAKVMGKILHIEGMEYADYLRLAAVAATPVAMVYLLTALFPALGAFRLLDAVIFALGAGYLYFAVTSAR